jgi:hypothetical protein
MQKSLVWRGFLSESMWVEDHRDLSCFKKSVFWVNYPFSYAKFLWVVVWDVLTDCALEIQEQDILK